MCVTALLSVVRRVKGHEEAHHPGTASSVVHQSVSSPVTAAIVQRVTLQAYNNEPKTCLSVLTNEMLGNCKTIL